MFCNWLVLQWTILSWFLNAQANTACSILIWKNSKRPDYTDLLNCCKIKLKSIHFLFMLERRMNSMNDLPFVIPCEAGNFCSLCFYVLFSKSLMSSYVLTLHKGKKLDPQGILFDRLLPKDSSYLSLWNPVFYMELLVGQRSYDQPINLLLRCQWSIACNFKCCDRWGADKLFVLYEHPVEFWKLTGTRVPVWKLMASSFSISFQILTRQLKAF